jgi:central kinetochore subunit Mis15/CHL4
MPRQTVSIPTTAPLPPTIRVDARNPIVQRSISRLSRASLIELALDWLDPHNIDLAVPSLRFSSGDDDDDDEDEEDGFYPRARSVEGLRRMYAELQSQSGSKKEVADRIVDGDWRHGLTLYQLAMVDFQHIHDHPTSLKWSAFRIVNVKLARKLDPTPKLDKKSLAVPRFHPSTFLQRLQAQVLPDSKAHFHFTRPHNQPVALLRILILDSPYNTSLALSAVNGFDASRTIVVAFPDNAPYIYISNAQVAGATSGTGETKKIRNLIVEGIPKALSRPGQVYALKPTGLSSKNLDALLAGRGPGPGTAAQGGWSVYVDEHRRASPLDTILPRRPLEQVAGNTGDATGAPEAAKRKAGAMTGEERTVKKAKVAAQARFGNSAKIDDGRGVEKVVVLMKDPYPVASLRNDATASLLDRDNGGDDNNDDAPEASATSRRKSGIGRKSEIQAALAEASDDDEDDEGQDVDLNDGRSVGRTSWRPEIKLTFQGSHVFAGIRQLVEAGIIDGGRMPGWLSGEEGVTVGVVKNGRIRGHKGSGL